MTTKGFKTIAKYQSFSLLILAGKEGRLFIAWAVVFGLIDFISRRGNSL
jgi:hypothetical protein